MGQSLLIPKYAPHASMVKIGSVQTPRCKIQMQVKGAMELRPVIRKYALINQQQLRRRRRQQQLQLQQQ